MSVNNITAGGEQCVLDHPVVSAEEWREQRLAFLEKEKALTRQKDQLDAERRRLPWVKVEKNYVFEGPDGPVTLSELFQDKSQLFIYHFMFGPDWEKACPGCSFLADHLDGANWHLPHADLALAVVSRAPYAKLAEYKELMGWKFTWVSSSGTDFNFDFQVSFSKEQVASGKVYYNFRETTGDPGDEPFDELPGSSVFYKNGAGEIFHTYSNYARGGESVITTFSILDFVPKGRNEEPGIMNWMHRHTEYPENAQVSETASASSDSCCGSAAEDGLTLDPPKIEQVEELNLAGLRQRYTFENSWEIPQLWARLDPMFGDIPGQLGMSAFGVCTHKEGEREFDYMAAAPVRTLTGLTGDKLTGITLPPPEYVKFLHKGNLKQIPQTMGLIYSQWAPTATRKIAKDTPFLEYYPEDFNPVTNATGVEIWLPLE